MAMGIVVRSTALARVAGMRTTMRVDGTDVLEVERQLELPGGRRRMLSAGAARGLGCCLLSSVLSSLGEEGTRFSLPGGMSRTLLSCLDSMRSGGEKGWMT